MNSTRARFRGLGLKGHLVLALAMLVMGIASLTTAAYASQTPPDPGITENRTLPPQQEGNDLKGDSELPWLFAVFIITWAAFFGYTFIMSRRQREMRREIETLKLALGERKTEKPTTGVESESSGA